jgi:hypothetical protein
MSDLLVDLMVARLVLRKVYCLVVLMDKHLVAK